MRTYSPKASEIVRNWHVIDATGKTLGRLAAEVACLLRGKHKPTFATHMDMGDFVIVINAAKVHVTGKKGSSKNEGKIYYWHTGYPQGFRSATFAKVLQAHPTRPIEWAVKGMLPHNRLGRAMVTRLKVYAGNTHPHQAQVAATGSSGAVK